MSHRNSDPFAAPIRCLPRQTSGELLFNDIIIILILFRPQKITTSYPPVKDNIPYRSMMSDEDDGDQLVTKPFKFVTGL